LELHISGGDLSITKLTFQIMFDPSEPATALQLPFLFPSENQLPPNRPTVNVSS